jgi:glycosyltransferase involved in cell wall biosynthesis
VSGPLWFLLPGDPDTPTGGYHYDRCIVAGLGALGWRVRLRSLHDSFPSPDAKALRHARETLQAIPDDATVLIDGLALGAMPALALQEASRMRLIALVHHPLADETGLSADTAKHLRRQEMQALTAARGVIVTSPYTARRLADYWVPRERLRVVVPGVDPRVRGRTTGTGGAAPSLICVATVTPRKGHDVLLQALAGMTDLDWRLDCIGDLGRDQTWSARVLALRDALGLSERVCFTGALSDDLVEQHYRRADLAVLATRFEGYGMAISEAVARGLPVVSTRGGAAAETLPAGAGVLVPVDDRAALGAALRRLVAEPQERQRLADGAWRAARALPTWHTASIRFAAMVSALSAMPARVGDGSGDALG